MKRKALIAAIVVVALASAGGYALWSIGVSQGMKMSTASAPAAAPGGKVLYWHDPMVPGARFDKPGKSPFMDMDLVPVYADEGGDAGVSISPRVQQNLGIRTAEVTRANIASVVRANGSIAWNDRDVALVQAHASGSVERLLVRAPFDRVAKGEVLAQLYVPDWVGAQEEFLAIRRINGPRGDALLAAARQRMLLAGMTDEQVRQVEGEGKVIPLLSLTAPIAGVVSELSAKEGMSVAPGTPLFRINGTATVWANAQVPEGLAADVRPGGRVIANVEAVPGRTFEGRVAAILPDVDITTRTIKVRVELSNPAGVLAPGMFALLEFASPSARDVLVVPSEAVIRTGERTVVMLYSGEGESQFRPVDVGVGSEKDGLTEIRSGLALGQKVVVSGQFLVDSEASLRATQSRMRGEGATQETRTK